MGFSFIHTSDIHLGRSFSDLSVFTDKMNICNEACFKAFSNIINLAIKNQVDFVLIAGDSFDSEEKDLQSKIIFIKNLKKLADNGIKSFVICGNHDSVNSFKQNFNYFNFDEKYKDMINIVGVTTDDYHHVFNYNDVANIHAISFENDESEDPTKILSKIKPNNNVFNIGLIHCDLDKTSSKYAPCTRENVKKLGYDYYALGHIHIPQEFDNIVYSGSPQGRTKKETGEHGCYLIQADDNKNITKKFIPTDSVRFTNLELDCSSYNDALEVFDGITELVNNSSTEDIELNLFKINLIGITDSFKDLSQNNLLKEYIISHGENEFNNTAVYEITNKTIPNINEKEIENDNGIIGIINNISKDKEEFYKNTIELHKNMYKQLNIKSDLKNELLNSLNENKEELLEKVQNEIKSLCKELYSME